MQVTINSVDVCIIVFCIIYTVVSIYCKVRRKFKPPVRGFDDINCIYSIDFHGLDPYKNNVHWHYDLINAEADATFKDESKPIGFIK